MPPTVKNKNIKNTLKYIKDHTPKSRFLWAMSTFVSGRSAYHQLGWFKSAWSSNSIDRNNNPIPWISYPAIHFLDQRCNKKLKLDVFEFGSGNSTLWWAKRANSVTALEHHSGWYEQVKKQLTNHKGAKVIFQDLNDDYPKQVSKMNKKYDVIVVDGRRRVDSAIQSLNCLKKGGVIIWDNTDREKYLDGINKLEKAGFKSIDFVGLVPIGNYLGQTTIFYKNYNILGI